MSLIIPANTLSGGYEVDNSLQFNGSNDYLSRTFGTATSRKKWTLALWVKRNFINNNQPIAADSGSNNYMYFRNKASTGNGDFEIEQYSGGSNYKLTTSAEYVDTTIWYHFVIAFDTTLGTANDRMKIYVDGSQVTSFGQRTNPSQNFDTNWNNSGSRFLGREGGNYWNGKMSEIVFIDGQQLAPTAFGEDDGGTWKPIEISSDNLTFGNNGFYLPFTNADALGEDFSGNDNDFTTNNIASGDQSTDTPTS